jgi:hypothetical protein
MADGRDFDLGKELAGADFKSARLTERLCKTMETLGRNPGASVWAAAELRSEAKAIYRMLGNGRLDMEEIKRAHRERTAERIREYGGTVLAVQDTTGLNYNGQKKMEGLGYNSESSLGINLHSCLAVTAEGVALGVLAQSAATRSEAKKERAGKAGKDYIPIEEKESNRWLVTMRGACKDMPAGSEIIHVCDREGDIYELFNEAAAGGQKFLIRAAYNRRIKGKYGEGKNGKRHILDEIQKSPCRGVMRVRVPRDTRRGAAAREAELEIRYEAYSVQRPKILAKNSELNAASEMNVIHVKEADGGSGEGLIEWFLLTNAALGSAEDACKMVGYYTQRWKIEQFHYVLKSGCNVEKLQESSVDKTALLVYLYSVIASFIMNVTYLARTEPDTPCSAVFDEAEWKLLYRAGERVKEDPPGEYPIEKAVEYLGTLGSTKRAPSDGPPGVKAVWEGLRNLYILLAYRDFCGSS